MEEKVLTFVVLAYKESKYLEECICSVLNQTVKSEIVIATSTPNDYIEKMAKKYKLTIKVNKGNKGIGNDFNFAVKCGSTKLVTIAHQDDIYENTYAEKIIKEYQKNKTALILFPGYYEIRKNNRIDSNRNLRIKRILFSPLRIKLWSGFRFFKRNVLRFGTSICCPAVTFVKTNLNEEILKKLFICNFKCNVDWYTWELLSKEKGKFIYIPENLMGHRISEESTTTQIIKENIRTKEDLEMLKKFWPEPFAKLINKFYSKAEESNELEV